MYEVLPSLVSNCVITHAHTHILSRLTHTSTPTCTQSHHPPHPPQRSSDPWSGQVAFPGGKREVSDGNDQETAEREAWEEVGLRLGNLHAGGGNYICIGQLDDHAVTRQTRTGQWLVLAPFIYLQLSPGVVPLSLQPDEIASARFVPFEFLMAAREDVAVRQMRFNLFWLVPQFRHLPPPVLARLGLDYVHFALLPLLFSSVPSGGVDVVQEHVDVEEKGRKSGKSPGGVPLYAEQMEKMNKGELQVDSQAEFDKETGRFISRPVDYDLWGLTLMCACHFSVSCFFLLHVQSDFSVLSMFVCVCMCVCVCVCVSLCLGSRANRGRLSVANPIFIFPCPSHHLHTYIHIHIYTICIQYI
jgi:8-oxo-dGTP pyrophosphatase MutT (NUDIX family)